MRPACPSPHQLTRTRLERWRFAVLLTLSMLLPAQTPPARIPELHSNTLTGGQIDLPASLQGKVGVLVVGFSRDSRAQATAWGKRLYDDFSHSPDVLYFELPVLEDVPRLLRGFVLRAIAREVSPAAQAHFLPISSNQAQWKSVAHFADPDAAYVLVVDPSGNVQWQTSGDATEERHTALHHAVTSLLAHQAATARPTP